MITIDDCEIEIEIQEETEHPRHCFATGDDEDDKAIVAEILRKLEYNPWAWCSVKVTVSYEYPECEHCGHVRRESESSYLGGCSYENEKDFREGGYFDDMVNECLDALNARCTV